MSILDVQLFGQVEVRSGGELLQPFPTKKSKGLFAFLVTNQGRAFPREVLAGMFWGDQPDQSARKCLRTAIWRTRSIVEPYGVAPGTYLTDRDHALAFNMENDVRVDIDEFERRIASVKGGTDTADSPFAYRALQDAVRLYRADFLDGIYDDWALRERRRLRSLLLDALDRLTACCGKRRDWSGAIMWSERLIVYDPLREDAHRNLMRFLYLAGNRPTALRSFEKLCRLLESELGIAPMAETIALYQAIRSGQVPEDTAPSHESNRTQPVGKKIFAPPTICPLIVMQDQGKQVNGLIPSAVFGTPRRKTGRV